MSKKFVVPSVFTAVDKFSGPVNKMSKNAETSMARMERKFRKTGDTMFAISRQSAMVGAAIITPLVLATREAVKFESAMADVAKVANVAVGSEQFKELGDQAKKLGVILGMDAKEAAGLMANLAQGGVAIEDLDTVSKFAGKMGVAFGISGDLAGESFIKTKNALGGTIAETEAVMDTINMFGNTTAAASDELVTFMAKGGAGLGRAVGASGSEIASFGAQFIAMGQSAEESATLMKAFQRRVFKNEELKSVFDKAGGGAEGMLAVIEKGSKLSGDAQTEYFSKFDRHGVAIGLLGKEFGALEDKVNASRDAMGNAGSVQAEFENRTNTMEFKLQRMKSQLTSVAISLGDALIPLITKAVEKITPLIEKFSTWVSENRGAVATIMKVTAVVGGLAVGIAIISGAVGVATKAFAIYKYGVIAFSAVAKAAKIAQLAWNAAMMANPIGLFIGVAAAATGAVLALSSAFSKQSTEQRLNNEINERALENSIDQRVEVQMLFNKLRKLNPESDQYAKTLAKVEGMQPGITKQFNLQKGAIDDLNKAEKTHLETIMEKAKFQAQEERLVENFFEIDKLKNEQATFWEETKAAWSSWDAFWGDERAIQAGVDADRQASIGIKEKENKILERQIQETQDQPANPRKTQSVNTSQMINKNTKEAVELTLADGMENFFKLNTKGSVTNNMAMPSTPTTN